MDLEESCELNTRRGRLIDILQYPRFRSLRDVSYSDECPTKKAFQYVKRMLLLFLALVKFCCTNKLFSTQVLQFGKEEIGGVQRNPKWVLKHLVN